MDVSRAESLRLHLTLQINDLTVTGEWTPRGGLVWDGVPLGHQQSNFPDPVSLFTYVCPDWLEQVYWPFVADCHEALTAQVERLLDS